MNNTPKKSTAKPKVAYGGKPEAGIGAARVKKAGPKFGGKFPKELSIKITTPRGVAIWPVLPPSPPDTKFNKSGDYRLKLRIPLAEAQDLMDECAGLLRRAVAHFTEETGEVPKMCESLPYSLEADDAGNETGNVVLGMKAAAVGKTKTGEEFTRRLPVVDAKRNPMSKVVGGGSTLRAQVTFAPFYKTAEVGLGLVARMEMVQVINLQQWSGADPTAAFDEEDGYEDDGGGAAPASATDAPLALGDDAGDM